MYEFMKFNAFTWFYVITKIFSGFIVFENIKIVAGFVY